MGSIIKSAIYKLSKDMTFRITAIIGLVLAILMNLIYLGLDTLSRGSVQHIFCTGQNMLYSSLSPVQNFGIAIPINLIIYSVAEFSNGTIRNKIIAGHRKSSIYLSMLLIGVIFTFTLLLIYVGISTGIASIIGGFDPNGRGQIGNFQGAFLLKYCLQGAAVYVLIAAFALFIATTCRSVGASMPIVLISILFLFFYAMTDGVSSAVSSGQLEPGISIWFNPMYTFGTTTLITQDLSNTWVIASIVCPLYWAIIFVVAGTIEFSKRDIK